MENLSGWFWSSPRFLDFSFAVEGNSTLSLLDSDSPLTYLDIYIPLLNSGHKDMANTHSYKDGVEAHNKSNAARTLLKIFGHLELS